MNLFQLLFSENYEEFVKYLPKARNVVFAEDLKIGDCLVLLYKVFKSLYSFFVNCPSAGQISATTSDAYFHNRENRNLCTNHTKRKNYRERHSRIGLQRDQAYSLPKRILRHNCLCSKLAKDIRGPVLLQGRLDCRYVYFWEIFRLPHQSDRL